MAGSPQKPLDAAKNLLTSWNQSFVTFNNQTTMLLSKHVKRPNEERELNCLLHDNRIFAFEKLKIVDAGVGCSSSEQNLLLNLLTTPRYRVMSALYVLFHLIDDINLIAIIVLTLIKGKLEAPTPQQYALFSVFCLDLFQTVILNINRYWFLQRLSIYFGLTLYGCYAVIIYLKRESKDDALQDNTSFLLVVAIVGIRFFAYILEEMVDLTIDAMMHNDLLAINRQKHENNSGNQNQSIAPARNFNGPKSDDFLSVSGPSNVGPEGNGTEKIENAPFSQNCRNDSCTYYSSNGHRSEGLGSDTEQIGFCSKLGKLLRKDIPQYFSVAGNLPMPDDIEYIGSISAWGLCSVYNEHTVWKTTPIHRGWFVIACFVPGILSGILLSLLLLLCLIGSLIPFIVIYIILGCMRHIWDPFELTDAIVLSNFWKEITNI